MRAELWWAGVCLSAGMVGGAVFSDLPVVAVVINRDDAAVAAAGAMPFADLAESAWCIDDGGCWRSVRDGLMISRTAGTVYEGIGLQDGDVLVSYDQTGLQGIYGLERLSSTLERERATCLTVYRGQETITMGLLLPRADGGADTAASEPEPADPCAKKTSRRRSSRRRSRSN